MATDSNFARDTLAALRGDWYEIEYDGSKEIIVPIHPNSLYTRSKPWQLKKTLDEHVSLYLSLTLYFPPTYPIETDRIDICILGKLLYFGKVGQFEKVEWTYTTWSLWRVDEHPKDFDYVSNLQLCVDKVVQLTFEKVNAQMKTCNEILLGLVRA